jgi:APA family basic amino acid/polyamine antiporter
LFFVNRSNFVPFVILQPGVLYGAYFIFFAYGGFARVAVIAEEIRDAKRNVPRAMLLSLAISTVFYIVVGLVAVGLAGPAKLAASNSPLKEAISVSGNVGAAFLVSVGGLLATASVLLTSIIGVSRMAYAMARRGDLPRTMSRLHMKHGTPHYAICIVGVLMTLLVLFIDLSSVIAISTFAMLFYYASANISALRLAPDKMMYPRTVPMIGVATCIGLLGFILFVSAQAWIVGILGLFAGSVYYVVKQKLSAPTRTSA